MVITIKARSIGISINTINGNVSDSNCDANIKYNIKTAIMIIITICQSVAFPETNVPSKFVSILW